MRTTVVVVMAILALFLAACTGGGGGEDPYAAPDMGRPEDLPAGNATPVADVDAGLALLQGASYNVDEWFVENPTSGREAGRTARGHLALRSLTGAAGTKSIGSAKNTTMSIHYEFAPAEGMDGVGVSGSADYSINNWPDSLSVGYVNASVSITQQLTITADHVSVDDYTISGREICNASVTTKIKGTYPDQVYSGSFKAGFGLACTVVDHMGGASAKFIISFAASASMDDSGEVPATGTLSVYNAMDNTLIGTKTLSGDDLLDFIVLAEGG